MQRRMRLEGQLSKLQRVPDDPTPLQQHINELVKKHSCACNPRHRQRMVRRPPLYLAIRNRLLFTGYDKNECGEVGLLPCSTSNMQAGKSMESVHRMHQYLCMQARQGCGEGTAKLPATLRNSTSNMRADRSKRACVSDHACMQGKGAGDGIAKLPALLRLREANMLGNNAGFSAPQRCHMGAHLFRPDVPIEMIDRMQSRAYIGQFSADGDVFVGGLLWHFDCQQLLLMLHLGKQHHGRL